MRCFKDFKDDRTCDLCNIINTDTYNGCKGHSIKQKELRDKLHKIESNCPHKVEDWDEYDKFYGCNKNGKGYGKWAEYCKPSLECEQHILKGNEHCIKDCERDNPCEVCSQFKG